MLPRLLILLLILALPVFAQEAPPDAVVPVPGEPPALPVAAEGDGEMIANMQYPNANVQAVLLLYETLTGKKVISDSSVQGNLNIIINSPVSKSEAVSIIEKSLILNGFSVVPSDGNVVKVLGPGKPTRSASIPIYSEPSQIPQGEVIISYVFKLNYADPTELANVLNQYLATGMPYTSFLPLPKTQAILVTETTSTIRNLIGLIAQIDNAPAGVVSEFLQLRRADAAKVVEYLNELFEMKQQQQQGAPPPGQPAQATNRRRVNPEEVPPPPEGISPEVGSAFLSEDNIIVGKIKLTADTRTNRIHVVTRPENLPFLRTLVSEFDANVDIGKPVTRPLRYVAAGEVLPILVQTLKEPGIETQEAQGGGTNAAGSTNSTSSGGGGGGGISGSSDSGGGGGGSIGAEQLNTQEVDTAPEAVTIGSTRLIADKRSNAIIIMGNEDVRQKVMKVIDEIDVRAPQVLLNTVIGELSLRQNEEFGFDYILRNFDIGKYISTAGLIRNVTDGLITPENNASNINRIRPSFGTSGGLAGVITIDNGLDIVVRALEGTDRFRVTSRPMIFTSNNKKAVIASGREVAVPVSSLTSQDAGVPVTSSNIQFKPIELRLEVVPLINAEDEVNLEILQRVDSEAGSTPIDGNLIPQIATRYIRTSVTIPNRATVILGGLIQEDQNRTRSGIPIISNIPVIGALFSNTTKSKERSELIVLIRPVVLHTKDDMLIQKHVEEQRLYLPNNLEDELTPEGVSTTTTVSEKNGSLWWKRSTKETIVDETFPVPAATPRRRNIYRN